MRLAIRSLELIGGERSVSFELGLNVITGEITTGKTTVFNLIKGILGAPWDTFTPELAATTTAVRGEIEIGNDRYTIIRPLVTTRTSRVDIAGVGAADRLPALEADEDATATYGEWMLEKLGLPRIRVPQAPTRPDSSATPVSIADYLNYCLVSQDDMGRAIFGHRDQFRNIKRRYVFQIAYGLLGVETAQIMEQLRAVTSDISALENQQHALNDALAGTPWENRAELTRQLEDTQRELLNVRERRRLAAQTTIQRAGSSRIRRLVLQLDDTIANAANEAERERASIESLSELHRQLQAQAARLNRAIAAGELFADYEFFRCPRCGSTVDQARGDEETCLLCLQHPSPRTTREDLIGEQERVADQARETRQLVESHRLRTLSIEEHLTELREQRAKNAAELDQRTAEFVSDQADALVGTGAEFATLEERELRLRDYLLVFERLDAARDRLGGLRSREAELRRELETDAARWAVAEKRLDQLETRFRQVMNEFHAPDLGVPHINRENFLPEVGGRTFDSLSSAGWKSLVNIAHAIAHHQTAIDLDLTLPGLLIIDRPSTHIGDEGLDLERVNGIYRYLQLLGERENGSLQIIVIENSVPDFLRPYVRLHLTEHDRLIPQTALDRVGFKSAPVG